MIILAVVIYPGLALAIGLTLLLQRLVEGSVPRMRIGAPPFSFDLAAGVASVALAALALALLPWPYHPAAGWSWIGSPLAIWAAVEGAFLVPLLPGLAAPSPLAVRAASREAQISLSGRFVIWLALGTVVWSGKGWSLAVLPGYALAALAGLLALPAAASLAPFGAERSLNAAGAEEGLDEPTAGLLRFARLLRGTVLLAALLLGVLPLSQIRPWTALLLIGAMIGVTGLALRQIAGALPRATLPAGLRWCWWRPLPLAVLAYVYLAIM